MAEDTSLKQSRKRALSNKPTTPTPASNDANPQAGLRDGHKQALIAWDVVSKMYPSVPNHYPKPPELKEIPFLARQAASKAALAYADNEKRQFDLDSGSRGAQDRKLKAALAQAAGIPARASCNRCAAGNGLWKTCSQAPTKPGESKDTLKGACASCFYFGGRTKCVWSSKPSTATSSNEVHEDSPQLSKENTDYKASECEMSPPSKRRRVFTEVSSSHRHEDTDPPKDSIIVSVPNAGSSKPLHTPQSIKPNISPLPQVSSDLKPQSQYKLPSRKRAHSRPSDTPDQTRTLAASLHHERSELREDEVKLDRRGREKEIKESRVVDLEQERDEYQAALQREKAKAEKLGEELLRLRANISSIGPDENRALQEEIARLRGRLKKQEALRTSTVDQLKKDVSPQEGGQSNLQERAADTPRSQYDRLATKGSNGAEDIGSLQKQLSLAKISQAAQDLELIQTKQQAQEAKRKHTEIVKELEERLARSTAAVENSNLELRKAGEKHDNLTKKLARLQSATYEALRSADSKISTLEGQLEEARKEQLKLKTDARDHHKAEKDTKQTIKRLNEEVNHRKEATESAQNQLLSLRSSEHELKEQVKTLEDIKQKLQILEASKDSIQRDYDNQSLKIRAREEEARKMAEKIKELEHIREEMSVALQESEQRQKALAKEIREVFGIWATGRLDPPQASVARVLDEENNV